MTCGSLFSGVGGFDLGFEQAGFTVAWQVEADEKARRVLRHRWPSVPIHDDVRTVGAHNLTPVEVLVGGFPCQDLSVAGQRKGLAGERSGLFFEFMRIAAELRPSWVVIENVPGLLTSDRGCDFHAVLATLADIGYGDRAYRILDSKYLGVAQRRRRVFIVASAGAEFGRAGAVLFEQPSRRRDSAAGGEAGARVAATLTGRSHRPGVNARVHANQWGELRTSELAGSRTSSRSGKQFEGVMSAAAPVAFDWQSGGEVWLNVGPQTSALTGHQTPAVYQCHGSDVGPMGTLRQGRGDVQSGVPFVASALSASLGHHGHSSPRGDGSDNLVAATLNSGGNSGGFRTEPGEHLVGVDLAHALTASHTRTGRMDPNGETFAVVPDVAPYLETTAGDYSRADGVMALPSSHGVRRLTPLECERLQGFPDGWTCLCQAQGVTAQCVCPDSPRYKQMGNAVTVPVIRWIAERLRAVAARRAA